MELHYERMNDCFEKWHISGLPFPCTLHHFTGPDGGDFHDHPWAFTTHIIAGGYVEEAMNKAAGYYYRSVTERCTGTSHHVAATHIHRIVALTAPDCWTFVMPGPAERETRFWRFGDGRAQSRPWHNHDWRDEP